MFIDYSEGLFIIVNTLISFYIVIYAFIFLNRTKKYPDRRPWELLFIGAIFFLVSQCLSLISIVSEPTFFGIQARTVKIILEFAYATLILMAFITQSQMILLSDMILITRKVDTKRQEQEDRKRRKVHMSQNLKKLNNLSKKTTSDKAHRQERRCWRS
ncbi:hypothetical protein ACFLTH_07260 [Bacteroidota bacterium]